MYNNKLQPQDRQTFSALGHVNQYTIYTFICTCKHMFLYMFSNMFMYLKSCKTFANLALTASATEQRVNACQRSARAAHHHKANTPK